MRLRLLPKEEAFFDLFNQSADTILQAARELQALLDDFDRVEERARSIKALEEKGDEILHTIFERLHARFITPLDREDIHELALQLDNVLDWIEAVSARMAIYQVDHSSPMAQELAHIVVNACEAMSEAVRNLRH